jgi:hypothetical protein
MKRATFGLVLSYACVLALAAAPARASTGGTTYDFPSATATPQFLCTEAGCAALNGYIYSAASGCSAGCAQYPPGPVDVSLAFSVPRTFPPSPCRMKSGTGTLAASWPGDPSLPTADGTFAFKARDSHTVDFSGSITASTLSVLPSGSTVRGIVTYPPSPCTGGLATAQITFGG